MIARGRKAQLLGESKEKIVFVCACFAALGMVVATVGIVIDVGNRI